MERTTVTVFVVDDEPEWLDLYGRALAASYRVRSFTDPAEALRAIAAEPPTCLVVDHRMPSMTGAELVRRCRLAGYEGGVLVVTAWSDLDEDAFAAQVELAYRVLPKPLRLDWLRQQVELVIADTSFRRALDGQRRFPRFELPVTFEVYWGSGWSTLRARNVSLGGVLLEWQPDARERRQLVLRFRVGERAFDALARLAHAGPRGAGLAFVDPPEGFRDALGGLITEHRYGGTPAESVA